MIQVTFTIFFCVYSFSSLLSSATQLTYKNGFASNRNNFEYKLLQKNMVQSKRARLSAPKYRIFPVFASTKAEL